MLEVVTVGKFFPMHLQPSALRPALLRRCFQQIEACVVDVVQLLDMDVNGGIRWNPVQCLREFR